ncbi:MAG: tetratricopeptide repeat protein, partial [Candidatus Freyarchaeota archaeon]
RGVGSLEDEARALNNMGVAYLTSGRLEDAFRVLQEAAEKARRSGVRDLEANVTANLAETTRQMGWLDYSARIRGDTVKVCEEMGNLRLAASQRLALALTLRELNRLEEAMEAAGKAREVFERVGDKRGVKAVESLLEEIKVEEKMCPSCGAVIAVKELDYCPLCDAPIKEEKRGRRLFGKGGHKGTRRR